MHRVSTDSGLLGVGDNCDETVEFQIKGQLFLRCSWKFVGKLYREMYVVRTKTKTSFENDLLRKEDYS